MKIRNLTLPALTVLIIMLLIFNSQVRAQPIRIEVNRIIDIRSNYALVTDTIHVESGGINQFVLRIPIEFHDKIFYLEALMENGERLQVNMVDVKEENITEIIVNMPRQSSPYTVLVKTYLINHLESIEKNFYYFEYPLYPTTNIKLNKCTVTVLYPQKTETVILREPEAEITEGIRWRLNYTVETLPPMNNTIFKTSFKAELTQELIERLKRTVNVENGIEVKDEIMVKNVGSSVISRENGFTIKLPIESHILKVYDDIGRLEYREEPINGSLEINVKPRVNIQPQWNYKIIIEYTLPREKWISGDGEATMKIPVAVIMDEPIMEEKVTVQFPQGTKIIKIEGLKGEINGIKVKFNLKNIIGIGEALKGTIEYKPGPTPFRTPTSIIAYTLLGGAIGAAIYLKRYRGRKAIKRKGEEEIEKLCETYVEKIELLNELKELNEEYAKGKMKTKMYRERNDLLRREIREVDKRIREIEGKVKQEEEEIVELIEKIEKEMGRMAETIRKLRDINRRYMAKRMGRNTYQREKEKYEKELTKTQRRLESEIMELKDYTA